MPFTASRWVVLVAASIFSATIAAKEAPKDMGPAASDAQQTVSIILKVRDQEALDNFVTATESNLDPAATFALVDGFTATAGDDGGAQVIFLDFEVQGILVQWAKDHDVDGDKKLYFDATTSEKKELVSSGGETKA